MPIYTPCRIQRAFKLLGAVLVLTCSNVTAAQTPPAQTFSDQQLESAGWTKVQIQALRAQAKDSDSTASPKSGVKKRSLVTYSSVFDNYMRFDDLPDIGWREANDTVGRIGGWRSYARIVQEEQKQRAKAEDSGEKQ